MPKGYLYAESEVVDPAEFERYREKSAAVSASFGGRYVVRRSEPVVLDGEWSGTLTEALPPRAARASTACPGS
jgi:uncharacterized protein (DUF1330 family)